MIHKINSSLRQTAWYICLFPVFFILFNLREVDYFVSWKELLPALACLLLGAFCLFYLLKFILKVSAKAGILAFLLLVFLLLYTDIYFIFNTSSEITLRNRYIVLIFLALFSVTGIALYRSKKTFARLTHYLNTLVLLLCLYEAILFIGFSLSDEKWSCYVEADKKLFKGEVPAAAEKKYPDIYLIIADMYTSSASLKKHWNFDNHLFSDSLANMGFYTATRGVSNYSYTPLSMASLLNTDYLADFDSVISNRVVVDMIAMSMVNDNSVVKKLSGLGYETKNLSLFRFNGEEKFYNYDFFSWPDYTLFHVHLFRKTIFFWWDIYGQIVYDPKVISTMTDSTLAISREKRDHPVFVYTHFPIPHDPFNFHKDGSLRADTRITDPEEKRAAYLEQLEYTNSIILNLASNIHRNTEKKSIILVLGDHGTRYFKDSPADRYENYTTLSSFYFPGENYEALYDSISHVNIFRAVFNEYFDEKLPRLEDKQGHLVVRPCR